MNETANRKPVAGRQVSVEIANLVVYDSPFHPGSHERLGLLIGAALQRMVERDDLPSDLAAGQAAAGTVLRVALARSGQDASEGGAGAQDHQLAHAVAAGVYQALGRVR